LGYAAGAGGRDAGRTGFAHTVLDSTPLDDAAATMDTVILICPAIRGPLKVASRH
jgi:hypothetical protein